ncbi:Bax inhibitor-1/YccA family protein [Schaalia georgiae]|nr:Bax inhibitor-1/YccA family protein [Schaalia georgiae]
MANPILDNLDEKWSPEETPAGYPAMPGYRVADQSAPNPYGGQTNPYGQPQGAYGQPQGAYGMPQGAPYGIDAAQMGAYEAAMNAPSADAVDRGRMTYDDVIVKTGITFGVIVVGAVLGWMTFTISIAAAVILAGVATLIAFGLGLANTFMKITNPALVLAYAVFEGLALGSISAAFETRYPGIVLQAVVATLVVFGVTLALFASGRIRNSPKLARFTLIALVSFVAFRLLTVLLELFGVVNTTGIGRMTVMGIPLGVIIGVVAVLIGTFCLVQDFDRVKVGVEYGAPARAAWTCAFGLAVTLVWMYFEILRLLSYLRND